ncbi:MAG: TIGR01212 family radical SAM protein [Clostridia bacterium]|nr:TIGR01212 family radical SAM protein [Clostridia bacterium]
MSQVSENPFKMSDTNKRYYTYDYFLKTIFGEKCAKITLDCGFTCPNIDGTRSYGGCIYCSGGSASRNTKGLSSILEQYENGKSAVLKKWQVKKFIPYLQAYTNSYTSTENFINILEQVSKFDGACMIDIATRADCLENEKLEYLNSLSKRIPIILELGLQTSNDKTAELINRAHTFAEFTDCFERVRRLAPSVKIGVHIINGLPSESYSDMMKTAEDVADLKPDILKIHLLHVIKGTKLAQMYETGFYTPLTLEQYVRITCDQIEIMPSNMVIERVTGDGERDSLLAPLWSLKKVAVINEIDKELFKRCSYQGIFSKK